MNETKLSIEKTKAGITLEMAAGRLWEKLEFWSSDIDLGHYEPDNDVFHNTWDLIASNNDLLEFLLDELEEECAIGLPQLHKDWAIYMFLHESMTAYNNEFGKTLEAKE